MKTFSEAIQTVSFHGAVTKREDIPAEVERLKERAQELASRVRGIMAEAHGNETVRGMLDQYTMMFLQSVEVGDDSDLNSTFRSCLFSMFMNGLITGMEMEKQEL